MRVRGAPHGDKGQAMDPRQQARAAADRYRATRADREATRRRQRKDGVKVVDTDEQLIARAGRLIETGQVSTRDLLAATEQPAPRNVLLERIIAEHNDLQPVTFLSRGAEVARSVARLGFQRAMSLIAFGTGFLVSPRLLLTNHHVLPDAAASTRSVAEFDYDPGRPATDAIRLALEPDRFFVTDPHLDYTLVAVAALPDGRSPGDEFGWNLLFGQQGKIVTGEPVNIVGHPMGRTKEVAIRNNELIAQLDDFLHYSTDTEPGSSGSPVFNDTWEVVALHHSGVPSADDEGNWLRKDGSRWHPSEGDGAVHWVANEGARISRVLAHLETVALDSRRGEWLAEMRADEGVGRPRVAGRHLGPPIRLVSVNAPADRVEGGQGTRAPSRPARSGVAATPRATDGRPDLVFVHGRGEQDHDPVALRATWMAGLSTGLARAGLPSVPAEQAWFPFYGDALAAALARSETLRLLDPDVSTAEALAPRTPTGRSLYRELLDEAATAAGMPSAATIALDESRFVSGMVGRLQRPLTWLANRSGLDDVVIARVFRDVAAYLDQPDIRELVLQQVLATVPTRGPVVLVCHSLGTIVGMDLLTRLPQDVEVRQLVTAGSPLGMDSVYKRLLVGGPHLPERVLAWHNAWCAADAVAIGCPLVHHWGEQVSDILTDNRKGRAHDIEEYLAHGAVARVIGEALHRD